MRLREKTTATLLIAMFFAIMIPMTIAQPSSKGKGGFDQWGYNYQARIFNGDYDLYNKNPNELTPGYEIHLVMWWNDAWLSNKDRDGDGNLDRHWGHPSYTGSDAWLTNHMVAVDDVTGKLLWTYFVKIIAPDYMPTDIDGDGFDDASGCEIIWGAFIIIQQVSNDPALGEHGILTLVTPAGFGAW